MIGWHHRLWWAWVWVNSGSLWWTGRPGVLRFMGSQRVWHDWATELNWTDVLSYVGSKCLWYNLNVIIWINRNQKLLVECKMNGAPWTASIPGFPVLYCLPEFTQVHWVSDAIHPSHPYCLLLLLPPVFPSNGVFSNESTLYIKY